MCVHPRNGDAKVFGLFLLLTLLVSVFRVSAQSLEISPEDQQVWLVWPDGKHEKLTNGPQKASAPAWSFDHEVVAFFRYCSVPAQCAPRLVLVDRNGKILKEFSLAATSDWEGCNSVTNIEFLDSKRIGFDCHINPSLGEYTTIAIDNGQMLHHWLGFAFTWSPDKSHIAYHGWIPHFSPPYGHSSYLRIDDRTVYPDDSISRAPVSDGQYRVEESNGIYKNIHEFYKFFWAPDSKKIAFIDRVYDWRDVKDQPSSLGEQNVRRFLTIVDLHADSTAVRIPNSCDSKSWIEWLDNVQLDYKCGDNVSRYEINRAGIILSKEKPIR
jgi:hypothetical protein